MSASFQRCHRLLLPCCQSDLLSLIKHQPLLRHWCGRLGHSLRIYLGHSNSPLSGVSVFRLANSWLKPLHHTLCDSTTRQPNFLICRRVIKTVPAVCQRIDDSKCTEIKSCSRNSSRHFTLSAKAIVEASPLTVQPYLKLIRFDRPIGTWLLFLPCAWSISLAAPAGQLPDPQMLALFAAGSFFMRAAACTINDMWDKDFDARVARTKDRPLACGQISQFKALAFLALPLSASLGILLTFNYNTIVLGACSMIPCIIYPLMKRVTYWPQAFLGVTLNWGVMIAWSAIRGCIDLPGFLLYSACVLHTMIYDTIYSHQDKSDDIQVGVKSTALKFGDQTKHWLAVFATGTTSGLAISGAMMDQPWLYYAGVSVVAAHLARQIYKVDLNDSSSCAKTFQATRNLGLVFWAFIIGAGLMMNGKDTSQETAELEAVED